MTADRVITSFLALAMLAERRAADDRRQDACCYVITATFRTV